MEYEWPEDKILKAAVEERGQGWLAKELGISRATLDSHLHRRGLPTKRKAVKLEISDALKKVAARVS